MSNLTDMLVNTVTIEKQTYTTNGTGEQVPSYSETDDIAASVQERTPRELRLPDVDGPVLIDTVIYTAFRSDIERGDILRQTDISPSRKYRVVLPRPGAGRFHHLEIDAERIWRTDEEVGS